MKYLPPRFSSLRRAVTRLIKAEVADSWKGSKMPEERVGIERELERARSNYHRQLRRLGEGL